jgi:hypothetical protein
MRQPLSARSLRSLIPIGNVNRQGFLEHSEERLLDCCVLVVQLKIRDGFALMIDVTLATLNAAAAIQRRCKARAIILEMRKLLCEMAAHE